MNPSADFRPTELSNRVQKDFSTEEKEKEKKVHSRDNTSLHFYAPVIVSVALSVALRIGFSALYPGRKLV